MEPSDGDRAKLQRLAADGEGWKLAAELERVYSAALGAHVARRAHQAGLGADRTKEICAAVWDAMQKKLTPPEGDPRACKPHQLEFAYLAGIANNKILDLVATLKRRVPEANDGCIPLWDLMSGPSRKRGDREVSHEHMRRALEDVLGQLSAADVELLQLRYVDGLMPQDILARAEEDSAVAATLALTDKLARIALVEPESAVDERSKLVVSLTTRVWRAKKRAEDLCDAHPLLAQYRKAKKNAAT